MKNALGTVDSVLLLGGRSEIGLAIVERLVRAGTRKVVLAAREVPTNISRTGFEVGSQARSEARSGSRSESGSEGSEVLPEAHSEVGSQARAETRSGSRPESGSEVPSDAHAEAGSPAWSHVRPDAEENPGDPRRREDSVARLEKLGADVLLLDFDATRPETHERVIDAAVEFAGDLDVVISAFGVLGDQARYQADPVAAAESITVNMAGHVSAGLFAARRLREQRHGTLIVLSSIAGVRVRRANFVYGSAKAGLDGFAQGLGDSLYDSGARVMIVRPGFVIGRMTAHLPAGPMPTTPDAVADAVVAGLREGRRVVWAPPALRFASLALRALPRAVWRRLKR